MDNDLRLQGQAGTFALLVDAQGVKATYYGGPNAEGQYDIDYNEAGQPYAPSIEVMMEYVAAAELAQKRQWPQKPQEARSAPQSGGGYSGSGRGYQPRQGDSGGSVEPPASNFVSTTDDDGYEVPGCPIHKLNDGRARPMKNFQGRWKCTAKLRNGGYCTNWAPAR